MAELGPAELVLTAAVARRHYLHRQSKVEIAEELGISRFKVARMLDAAREMGLVRIEIVRQGTLDLDASARLQEEFGLRHAMVVDVHDRDAAALRHELGEAAAHLLQDVVTPRDVLGLPWSRTVHAVVGALESLPPVEVVQLTGAIVLPDFDSSAVDIVRRASRLADGTSRVFYAPFVARRRRQRRGAAAPAACGGGPGPGVIGHDRGRRDRGVGARGVHDPRPPRGRGAG